MLFYFLNKGLVICWFRFLCGNSGSSVPTAKPNIEAKSEVSFSGSTLSYLACTAGFFVESLTLIKYRIKNFYIYIFLRLISLKKRIKCPIILITSYKTKKACVYAHKVLIKIFMQFFFNNILIFHFVQLISWAVVYFPYLMSKKKKKLYSKPN